jgi:DNA-binding FadR family transcriptional regulator
VASITLSSTVIAVARRILEEEPFVDERVADELGLSRETIRLALNRLSRYGAISIEELTRGPKESAQSRTIVVHTDSWVWSAIAKSGVAQ